MQHDRRRWAVPGHEKYTVDAKGRIYKPDGWPAFRKVDKGTGHRMVWIAGLKRKAALIAVAAYYGAYGTGHKIKHKNGDLTDCSLDNLKVPARYRLRDTVAAPQTFVPMGSPGDEVYFQKVRNGEAPHPSRWWHKLPEVRRMLAEGGSVALVAELCDVPKGVVRRAQLGMPFQYGGESAGLIA